MRQPSTKHPTAQKAGVTTATIITGTATTTTSPTASYVMEFAVVRNNVYKLAVTKLGQLGHPLIPTNDPDKPTPDTPDEEPNVYVTVTCEVIPWVVRINNIEF